MSNKNNGGLQKFNTPSKLKESKKMDEKMALLADKILNPKPKKENDEILYNLILFAQIFFPYKHTNPTIPKVVKQGSLSMMMESISILDSEGEAVKLGLPYGTKVRLLLHLIASTAIKTKNKRFLLADTYQDLVKKIGGRNRSSLMVDPTIEQLVRLANTTIRTKYTGNKGVFIDSKFLIEKIYLPKNKYLEKYDKTAYQKEIDNKSDDIKGIWIQINQDYYDVLTKYRLPIDRRSVMLLNENAQALDILNWLSYRLYKIEDPNGVFISWKSLYHQFGFEYKRVSHFKQKFIEGMSYAMYYGFPHEMDNVKYNENGTILFPVNKDNWPTRSIKEPSNQLKFNFK